MNLENAKNLKYGQTIYHKNLKNADKSPMRFKVNGMVKILKKSPLCVRVPLKHGLYEYGYMINRNFEYSYGNRHSFIIDISDFESDIEMIIKRDLANCIYYKQPLTETEIDGLIKIIGSGCRQKTKRILYHQLHGVPDIKSHGIYSRIQIKPEIQYNAGQSYPDEIRTIRNLLINR